ncbi:MAG: ribulose-phosphate 3-epimerase [Oscillospiraceae bacterium]|nr:ribulose-phosphate 3-epimerase [Oscillospiraceae bacterium]
MVKVAPSILSADFAKLGAEVEDIRLGGADYVHFDVMDGRFVPNISIGIPVLRSLRRATDLFIDAHLMILEPIRYAEAFCKAGADLVNVHVEADSEENILAALDAVRALGKKCGITLKPGTPAEAVLPYIEKADLILVMTVEPGFGGQSFMHDMLPKIAAVRGYIDRYHPGCELEVDGGIDAETSALVKEAGANVLVAGSAVFKAADRAAAIRDIRNA